MNSRGDMVGRTGDERHRFPGHEYPQVIPEPDEVRPGGRPPWADLAPTARRGLSIERVARALARRGQGGHPPEAPSVSRDPGGVAPSASVLVALFDVDGEAHVVLTRRARTLRAHRGEVALPGGRRESGESPWETALREAREEVGLDPASVRPLGWLTPLSPRVAPGVIMPVVGALAGPPALEAQPDEVERVFTVSLAEMLAEGAFLEERWRREGMAGLDDEGFFPIYFYRVPGDLLWGATARVLTDLLTMVSAEPALGRPPLPGG